MVYQSWDAKEELILLQAYQKNKSYEEIALSLQEKGYYRSIEQCCAHISDLRIRGNELAIRDKYFERDKNILLLYKKGFSLKYIARIKEMSIKTVESVIYSKTEHRRMPRKKT